MLVWRAHKSLAEDASSLHNRIVHWMDALQNRMPGAYMILVVTHIDSVDGTMLNLLCDKVEDLVQSRLRSMAAIAKEGTPSLNIFREGQSARVNCLSGAGIMELRKSLISFTCSMPWYRESLPGSWIRTQEAIQTEAKGGKAFLDWSAYAEIAKLCGLTDAMLISGTKFLHETGVIRYFGNLDDLRVGNSEEWKVAESIRKEINVHLDNDCEKVVTPPALCKASLKFGSFYKYTEDEVEAILSSVRTQKCLEEEDFVGFLSYLLAQKIVLRKRVSEPISNNSSRGILQKTVFISPYFMINVMKGLIRHDRNALLSYFMNEKDQIMIRRVKRLSVSGRLHVDLKPFMWPSTEQSRKYWTQVKGTEEGEHWQEDVISDNHDLDRAVALLEGFDLLANKETEKEIMVPGVLPETRIRISGDAFNTSACPFYLSFSYLALPEGAYESVVVRIAKAVSRIEYSSSIAVFYHLGHMGQLFCRNEVGKITLNLRASSRNLLLKMKQEILNMEEFFPGLIRLSLHEPAENKTVVEPAQVLILADDLSVARELQEDLQKLFMGTGEQQITIVLQLPGPSDHRAYLGLSMKERDDYQYYLGQMQARCCDKEINSATFLMALKELKFEVDEHRVNELLLAFSKDRRTKSNDDDVSTDTCETDGNRNADQDDTRRKSLMAKSGQGPKRDGSESDGDESSPADASFTSILKFMVQELSFFGKLRAIENSAAGGRVVLACITPGLASCSSLCAQLERHFDFGRAVIPILMPGFQVESYTCWWPPNIPGFENHRLFVDLRRPESRERILSAELKPQLIRFLQDWRAKAQATFQGPGESGKSTADAYDPSRAAKMAAPTDDGMVEQAPTPYGSRISTSKVKRPAQINCPECILNGYDIPAAFRMDEIIQLYEDFLSLANKEGSAQALRHKTCPQCSANVELVVLLAPPPPPEAVPCPSCVHQSRFPPGSFEVSQCRLLLDEQDRQRAGTVTCPVCLAQLRIADLAQREVFGSYCWGAKLESGAFSTQSTIVLPILRAVEERAEIMCWVDVEGGMGAGQDHLKEMLRGVEAARIFLVFLSDAYVASENCVREFVHATSLCRYMIPVLLPKTELAVGGNSAGWSGPDKEDPLWWKHAAQVRGDRPHPDTKEPIDWACLSMYTPITLESGSEALEIAVDEIVFRTLSRLHRSAQLNNNTLEAKKRMSAVLSWRLVVAAAAGRGASDDTVPNRSADKQPNIDAGRHHSDDGKNWPNDQDSEIRTKELRRLFDLIDTDGSQAWDKVEVQAAVQALGMGPAAANELMDLVDRDASGSISFDELVAFATARDAAVSSSPPKNDPGRLRARAWRQEDAFAALAEEGQGGVLAVTFESLERFVQRAFEAERLTRRLGPEELRAMIAVAAGCCEGGVLLEDLDKILQLSRDLLW
jgi:hypothetical protein